MKNKSRLNRFLALCVLIFIAVNLSGCGQTKKTNPVIEEQKKQISEHDQEAAYHHFTNANLFELFEANEEALLEYKRALIYNPESSTIRNDYSRLLFRLHHINEALEQALLVNDKDTEVYLLIGDCFRLTDRYQRAIPFYRQAVEKDPDNINAYWYMAGYYRQADQLDSAVMAYRQLARLSDTYRIWHELGILLGRSQQYTEALGAFRHSIELNNEAGNINSYLGMATTYDIMDSVERAEEVFYKAAEIDSTSNTRIYRQLLSMYMKRRNYEKATGVSEKLIALVPSDWEAVRRHGFLLFSQDRLEEADSLFRNRIEFGDDHLANYFYIGLIAMNHEKYGEAEAFFHKTIEKDSSYVDGWLNLAFSYQGRENYERAIGFYKQGMEYAIENSDRNRFLFSLGSAYERIGRLNEAIEMFEEVLKTNPEHAQSLNYLGYTLADAGIKLDYALELIEKALEISPDNGAYLDSYAWVQYRLGNFRAALSGLEKAIGLIDNDPIIFEHLGDVYKALGNHQEAKRQYEKALEIDPDSINLEEKMK